MDINKNAFTPPEFLLRRRLFLNGGLKSKKNIVIKNGSKTEIRYCEIGEQVRLVAEPAPQGKKFAYFMFNKTPYCYSTPYTFTVYEDTTIESVYVDVDEIVIPEAVCKCISFNDAQLKKIAFVVRRMIPAGSIKEHGLIVTDSKGWEQMGDSGFIVGGERITQSIATTIGLSGNYRVNLRSTRDTVWYGRGYVMYTDKNGETKTLYSDVTSIRIIINN